MRWKRERRESTVIDEQREASDLLKAEDERRLRTLDANVENALSVTEVNRALVGYHESRAVLRRTFASCASAGAVLAVAWSVWAMVHWA
jgi:hypothetical protein